MLPSVGEETSNQLRFKAAYSLRRKGKRPTYDVNNLVCNNNNNNNNFVCKKGEWLKVRSR